MKAARLSTLAILLSVTGCRKPDHACEIRGHLLVEDDAGSQACSLDLYLDGRADRLVYFPVATGNDFRVAIHFPIIEPRSQWYGIVRCAGYLDARTPPFELGSGWLACAPADLGTITVKKAPS